jgi:hypothetical protein
LVAAPGQVGAPAVLLASSMVLSETAVDVP